MKLFDKFRTRAEELRVLNAMVYRDGALLGRLDLEGEIRRNQYSVSKSFTSVAVGIAREEGLLRLEEKVTDCFPDDLPGEVSDNLAALTVRDLLTMCTGQAGELLMGEQRIPLREDNWVSYVLSQPFPHRPGEQFVYSNMGPYLAAQLVERRAGMHLVDYLMPRLFTPLDIPRPTWETDTHGGAFGASGLMLGVSETAKFALLCLNGGQWEGRQLVPAAWLEEATRKQVENGGEGYGYLFWLGPDNSYRCDGRFGQFGIVLPDRNAVIAVNAECREQDKLLAWIHETLVPELG